MEQEKEKLVGLSKTSWHYKLVRFCWNIEPDKVFKNLCPYFWLSIASILVVIPIGIYRVIISLAKEWGKYIDKTLDKVNLSRVDSILDSFDKMDLFFFLMNEAPSKLGIEFDEPDYDDYRFLRNSESREYKALDRKVEIIRDASEDYYVSYSDLLEKIKTRRNLSNEDIYSYKKIFHNRVEEIRKRVEKERAERAEEMMKKDIREKKMKERLYVIGNYTKSFLTGVFIAILIAFGFIIQHPFIQLTLIADGEDVLGFLKFVLIVCAALAFLLCCVFLGIQSAELLKSYKDVGKDALKGLNKFEKVSVIILLGLAKTAVVIKDVLVFLYKYLIYYPLYKFLYCTILGGIGRGFVEGIQEFGGIFSDYFNASYSDYCPSIDWDNEEKEKENN